MVNEKIGRPIYRYYEDKITFTLLQLGRFYDNLLSPLSSSRSGYITNNTTQY